MICSKYGGHKASSKNRNPQIFSLFIQCFDFCQRLSTSQQIALAHEQIHNFRFSVVAWWYFLSITQANVPNQRFYFSLVVRE